MTKRFISFCIALLALWSCSQHDELLSTQETQKKESFLQTKTTGETPMVVGYFPSWSETYPSTSGTRLRNIPEEVTHIFLSFIKPNMRYVKGSFDIKNVGIEVPYDGLTLKETVDILKAKGIKVILSIGGETYWGSNESYDIDHQNIADFVRDFGFDGIDWDYEPNGGFQTIGEPENVERFISMIKSSRELLPRSEGYIIACAPAGCGALGRPTPYAQNDDSESPYSYANRAIITGDDLSNEYNSTSTQGYTISLYGFASTGHMIPVFRAAGDDLDLVAFQGYNTGSASQREIMYDSYAYYANKHNFKVAFGMHIPDEPWGPYYVYDESKLREYTSYVAQGGRHDRAGKGDGVMFWQLLQVSSIDRSLDGIEYSKIAYSILEDSAPITTPTISISSPVNNALIREGKNVIFSVNVKRAERVEFFINNILLATVTEAPFSVEVENLAVGTHSLKAKAISITGETVEKEISIKIIDKNSVENIPLWDASAIYAIAGNQVLYNNIVWSNAWWTCGDEPGRSDVWKYVRAEGEDGNNGNGGDNSAGDGDNGNNGGNNGGDNGGDSGNNGGNNGGDNGGDSGNNGGDNGNDTDVEEYDPSKKYSTAGTIVIYQNKKYKNKWWVNPGDYPGNPNGPWELILENGEGSTPEKALDYDIMSTYPNAGTFVNYNGKVYTNKWYVSAGDYPGKDEWGPWEIVK